MGNFQSAPRQRPQGAYALREGTDTDFRALACSLKAEADANTLLLRQKYERRERRHQDGSRPRRRAPGPERSSSDHSMRGDQYLAPGPGPFNLPAMGNSGYPYHRGRSGNRRGSPRGYQFRHKPGRDEFGLHEDGFAGAGYPGDLDQPFPNLNREGPISPQQGGASRTPDENDRQRPM
ncbi:MAG: hypothetical protein Q9192_002539 [Flavoplaca navasiana]